MNIKLLIVIIAILLGGMFALGNRGGQRPGGENDSFQQEPTFTIGQKAPDFTLKDFEGNSVALSDYYGKKAVILDFWAAWCPFCIGEMLELEKVHQAYGDRLAMIGVHRTDSGESTKQGKTFADEKGVTYLLVQGTNEIYKAATRGLNAMPVAIFIDKNGIVQDVKFGPKTEAEIKEKVEKLL